MEVGLGVSGAPGLGEERQLFRCGRVLLPGGSTFFCKESMAQMCRLTQGRLLVPSPTAWVTKNVELSLLFVVGPYGCGVQN